MQIPLPCPECGVPATITGTFSLASTDGPVDHVVVDCAAGHHFRMAADRLPSPLAPPRPALTALLTGRPVLAGSARGED